MKDNQKRIVELTIKQNQLAEKLFEESGGFLNKTLMTELLKTGEELRELLKAVEVE